MILPNKYLTLSESLIGISSLILNVLGDKYLTLDELWNNFKHQLKNTNKLKYIPTYNKFILSINFMYMTKMIDYTEKGVIYNENIKHESL